MNVGVDVELDDNATYRAVIVLAHPAVERDQHSGQLVTTVVDRLTLYGDYDSFEAAEAAGLQFIGAIADRCDPSGEMMMGDWDEARP